MKFFVPFVIVSGLAALEMVPAPAVAAAGLATRVHGGFAPASSGTTAYDAIGGTNRAGIGQADTVESVQLNGQASATSVDTLQIASSR